MLWFCLLKMETETEQNYKFILDTKHFRGTRIIRGNVPDGQIALINQYESIISQFLKTSSEQLAKVFTLSTISIHGLLNLVAYLNFEEVLKR